jgi:hypothetical protein
MAKSLLATTALRLWFAHSFAALPSGLHKVVCKLSFPRSEWGSLTTDQRRVVEQDWDMLTPKQRRMVAEQFDAQHPTDAVGKLVAELDFRQGFKRVSVPLRNRRNAKRPRPSKRKVSNADIQRVKCEMAADDVKPHKQCSEAYRRLFGVAPPISLRGFRKRWNRLGFGKGT